MHDETVDSAKEQAAKRVAFLVAWTVIAALSACCLVPSSCNHRDTDRMRACGEACGERGMREWSAYSGCQCRE